MIALIRSAYFKVSEENAYGRIILRNGNRSQNFYSKKEAYDAVKSSLDEEILGQFEGKIILQQIEDSSLPKELSSEKRNMISLIESLEELMMEGFDKMRALCLDGVFLDEQNEHNHEQQATPPGTTLH